VAPYLRTRSLISLPSQLPLYPGSAQSGHLRRYETTDVIPSSSAYTSWKPPHSRSSRPSETPSDNRTRMVCSGVPGVCRNISLCIARMWLAPLASTNSRSNVLIETSVIFYLAWSTRPGLRGQDWPRNQTCRANPGEVSLGTNVYWCPDYSFRVKNRCPPHLQSDAPKPGTASSYLWLNSLASSHSRSRGPGTVIAAIIVALPDR
jgi:hypothetical protein